jgi:hypothetical protein
MPDPAKEKDLKAYNSIEVGLILGFEVETTPADSQIWMEAGGKRLSECPAEVEERL